MWFKELMGFNEINPEHVKENLRVSGINLVSKINGKSYQYGVLDVLTLASLKKQLSSLKSYTNKIQVSEIIGDVQKMHCNSDNKNALFQAASQFNLLEMVSPTVTPEMGVDRYEYDKTQGPACAIACGAGTIYRNYFAEVNGIKGQSTANQIDCLNLIGEALNNKNLDLWEMSNGYALVSENGLKNISAQINKMSQTKREKLKEQLKVGIQWNTEVTIANKSQIVSQIYCSALPVAYTSINADYWEAFARIVLEATYEATLCAGLINYEKTGSKKVFLTLVGGGVFGNKMDWILDAIQMAIKKFKNTPLDIKIVSYSHSNHFVKEMINSFNSEF